MNRDHLLNILEEEALVSFTGRINVLDSFSKQGLGFVLMYEGQIIHVFYKKVSGQKAFFNLFIEEFDGTNLSYVVEPEMVDISLRTIHFPFSVLKQKLSKVISEFKNAKENTPPADLRLLPVAEFLSKGEELTNEEFLLLKTMSEFSKVSDIYQNSDLLDYEITSNLVRLRKKGAIRVIKAI